MVKKLSYKLKTKKKSIRRTKTYSRKQKGGSGIQTSFRKAFRGKTKTKGMGQQTAAKAAEENTTNENGPLPQIPQGKGKATAPNSLYNSVDESPYEPTYMPITNGLRGIYENSTQFQNGAKTARIQELEKNLETLGNKWISTRKELHFIEDMLKFPTNNRNNSLKQNRNTLSNTMKSLDKQIDTIKTELNILDPRPI